MNKLLPTFLVIFILISIVSSLTISGFAKDVVKKKKQLDGLMLEEKNLPALQDVLTTNSEKILILEKTFPKKENLVSVVQSIDTLSAQTGVLASFHFESEDPKVDSQGNSVLPVSITIEGSFTNCYAFLSGLEKNRYLYVVDLLGGTATGGLKGENKLIVKGNLYVGNK